MQAQNFQSMAQARQLEQQQALGKKTFLQGLGAPPSIPGVLSNGAGPTNGNAAAASQPQQLTPDAIYQQALSSGLFSPDEARNLARGNREEVKDYQAVAGPDGSPQWAALGKYGSVTNTGFNKPTEVKIENGVAYDPNRTKPGAVFNDINQPFLRDQNGNLVPNTPFQQFQLQKSKAGASQTNVRVDNKMGESLAGQIGPMMKDSQAAADAAVKQIQAADSIDAALASGNIITGSGANTRLSVAQMADTIGIGGASQKEKLANTRQALQGLAQLTLQGRQQMRGQGAITESESRLAERAVSGDLSFTPAELQVLTNSARRAGRYSYDEHSRKVKTLSDNPDYAAMVPFYSVPPLPTQQAAPAQATGGMPADIGNLLNKYGGTGGR
jgi:hypothetical protein